MPFGLTVVVSVCTFAATPTAEQAPPPRPARPDALTRLKNAWAERNRSPDLEDLRAEFEEARLRHLGLIARERRKCLEMIDLFEKAQGWTKSPELRSRYRGWVEGFREELEELDERERKARADGPPLPQIDLPPRR